jgi:hypothetical protein
MADAPQRRPPVEDDDPRERPEPPQATRERLNMPHVLDVRGEARHVHQVERPVAEDLVGDVRAVRRLDVARLGSLHTLSLARIQWTRTNVQLRNGRFSATTGTGVRATY